MAGVTIKTNSVLKQIDAMKKRLATYEAVLKKYPDDTEFMSRRDELKEVIDTLTDELHLNETE